MPVYIYRCKQCNQDEEAARSVDERDAPKIHKCGNPMVRIPSLPQPPIIRKTGKGMALDTLNSQEYLGDKAYRARHEKHLVKGLTRPPKTIW